MSQGEKKMFLVFYGLPYRILEPTRGNPTVTSRNALLSSLWREVEKWSVHSKGMCPLKNAITQLPWRPSGLTGAPSECVSSPVVRGSPGRPCVDLCCGGLCKRFLRQLTWESRASSALNRKAVTFPCLAIVVDPNACLIDNRAVQ